jgi:hypothetical protein
VDIGVRYLGFTIPLTITHRDGSRPYSSPWRGICVECEQTREFVYIRWDIKPYCQQCLQFDLAESDPSDEIKRAQKHPPEFPIETPYWKVKGAVDDGLDLHVYERAFQ